MKKSEKILVRRSFVFVASYKNNRLEKEFSEGRRRFLADLDSRSFRTYCGFLCLLMLIPRFLYVCVCRVVIINIYNFSRRKVSLYLEEVLALTHMSKKRGLIIYKYMQVISKVDIFTADFLYNLLFV